VPAADTSVDLFGFKPIGGKRFTRVYRKFRSRLCQCYFLVGIGRAVCFSEHPNDAPQININSWIECDSEDATACPTSPTLTSVTSDSGQIFLSWTWGEETPVPTEVTDLVVRVSPGEHELIVTATQTSATIQGLDSETQYLLTVTSAAGLQLGIPSDPLTATTLAATALKPQATPGDVNSLIVTLKTDRSTESVVASAASDLAVAGVSVEEPKTLAPATHELNSQPTSVTLTLK